MNEYKINIEKFLQGKNLNKVTSLNLKGQMLHDVPSIVFDCKNLSKLNLCDNNLTSIPRKIERLKKLKILNVSRNQLTYIPAPVFRLPKLNTIDISHNNIKTIPKQLGSSHIKIFIANNNRIENIDFSLICNIERLALQNNNIKLFSPSISLHLLKHLWLKGNPCTLDGASCLGLEKIPNIKRCYPIEMLRKVSNSYKTEKDNDTHKNDLKMKQNIFISYAHEDSNWLNILKTHLAGLRNIIGGIDYWDDERIRTGDNWKEEIENALKSANAAILIISPDFLASDFILNNELPPILKKANDKGTHVFPIIARHSLFNLSNLSDFQSVNPPDRPLNACHEADIDKYFCKLMEDIIEKMNLSQNR